MSLVGFENRMCKERAHQIGESGDRSHDNVVGGNRMPKSFMMGVVSLFCIWSASIPNEVGLDGWNSESSAAIVRVSVPFQILSLRGFGFPSM